MAHEKGDFFQRVYDAVRQIPPGRVCTYGMIASRVGSPGAARMVGWALNKSASQQIYVPAHRVVNRNGLLTGKSHFNPPDIMQRLLEEEGIIIIDNQIQNLEKHLWYPDHNL